MAEMASGADGDRSILETWRLTGRDCNSIRYFNSMFSVGTKYMISILIFRCHPGMDFDIGQREGRYCVLKTD
jgi:hypothetical protein